MNKTKASLVNGFVSRAVHEAIAELAIEHPSNASFWASIRDRISFKVSCACTSQYRLLELDDIMHWRKREIG